MLSQKGHHHIIPMGKSYLSQFTSSIFGFCEQFLVIPNLVIYLTFRHGFSMALIEMDGLPFLIAMVDRSMAGKL